MEIIANLNVVELLKMEDLTWQATVFIVLLFLFASGCVACVWAFALCLLAKARTANKTKG